MQQSPDLLGNAFFIYQYIEYFVSLFRTFLWNGPALILLLLTGIYTTIKLRGVQFRWLATGFKIMLGSSSSSGQSQEGEISSFQAIMTALAGAIGTGNITGIATAVVIGGYGSLFWMWVVAALGMATAYSETILGHVYRVHSDTGEVCGGPMYTMKSLNMNFLAKWFAIFGAISAFGYAMVQSNSVVDAVIDVQPWMNRWVVGVVVAIVAGTVIVGGVKSIGRIAAVLVPFMAILYIATGLTILAIYHTEIPSALLRIFNEAFNFTSITGGVAGSGIMIAMQTGAQYGMFANEAGLGSYSISGATSTAKHPVEQGILSMTGVFIATMLVCTITGLVLAVTSADVSLISERELIGSPLAMASFSMLHPNISYILVVGLMLFAFTTLLAWAYYGEKCVEFKFGAKSIPIYRWLYLSTIVVGAVLELKVVWAGAHIANGLMVIPNVISIILLINIVKNNTKEYSELYK